MKKAAICAILLVCSILFGCQSEPVSVPELLEPAGVKSDTVTVQMGDLKKVSISPWCDEALMGERLHGTGITYLRKPPATLLGMDTPELDETAVLDCFRKTAKAAKDCKLEIAQRDVYMVGHSAQKVKRYVELARIGLEG